MSPNRYSIATNLSRTFDSPFVLMDVGCSGGIDPRWRCLTPNLTAHAFDPQVNECENLRAAESSPTVHYHAAKVGLAPSHPVAVARAAERLPENERHRDYFSPVGRSSAMRSPHLSTVAPEQSNAIHTTWSDTTVAVDTFCREEGVETVDFLKIDTDGFDLEVLYSAESMLDSGKLLGLLIESTYAGVPGEHANTLSNIDGYLRQYGYMIFNLEINRYSRRNLPTPFCYDILAQTTSGQAIWGDVLFMRDINHPAFSDFSGGPVTRDQVLKTACIFDLFGLPDCTADTLITHRELLADINVDGLLNEVTRQVTNGRESDFARYIERYETRPESFFPSDYSSRGFVFRNPLTRPFARFLRDWLIRQ